MARSWFFCLSARVALAALVFLCATGVAAAKPVSPDERVDRKEPLPKRLEGIDVVERLDQNVPHDLRFVDDRGRHVRLGDYLDGELPVILTLNYSNCPMLCSLQLNGLVESLKKVDWSIGKEYQVVTVVLDPNETPERSAETKARYVSEYGREGAADGWHFLTGDEAQIRAAADAIGFSYGYNEARDEYVHPAAIAMLTPDGRVARYLYGIEYHPKTVRLSLVEVGEGEIGSSIDRLILYCFHYDETEGRYAPVAMNIMRVGGGVTVVVLGGFLTSFWMAEKRKKKKNRKGSGRSEQA